jgi:uroporphyrinogen decarboxylase
MGKFMNHRERMEALLRHEAVDQIPVSFWRHFPVDDQSPDKLAAATVQFQNTFDFDFIKVSPASSFCIKDWGVQDEWKGNLEGTREYIKSIVFHPEDWNKLKVLDPYKGTLGNQLECLRLLKKEYGSSVPIIQTIFSPLAQSKHLVENGMLLKHLRSNPEEFKAGLEIITKSTADFISACKETGIDGIYYAIQFASYDLLSPAEFEEFQASYDCRLFPLMNDFWLNVAHIHGKNIMSDEITATDYPVQLFNWHDRETAPDLKTGKRIFNKVVSGGLSRIGPILLGDETKIKPHIDDAIEQTQGKDFALGVGCVLMQATPYGNIRFAVDYVRSIRI